MSYNQKKFLDYNGLIHLLEKFDDYPTNDILGTVINSIDSAISAKVSDVQINGTSIVSNNIANIPIASSDYGVVKINPDYGIGIFNGTLLINQASADNIKSGNNSTKAVSAMRQHEAVFYGLSKVAGVDLKNETVTLGTYPATSKTAILTMLGAAASSDIPDISGKANTADLATVATSGSYNDLLNKPFIPSAVSDLTDDSGHYTKPVNGIPATDMTSGVQTSLGLADTAYQKPNNGIPASDLASGVIPSVPVQDVQIKNTSILNNGIANIPLAANGAVGLVQGNNTYGTAITAAGDIMIYRADDSAIKNGNGEYKPIVPYTEHQAVFYGLAKAAGDTTQRESQNNVGIYTSSAQSAIQAMLDVPSTSFVASSIASAIGNVNSFDMAVVQALPTQDINTHTIYLVPKIGETNDVYDEYIYINNAWEMIGNTQIDLSNYVQKTDYATNNTAGIVKTSNSIGILSSGEIGVIPATNNDIKEGINGSNPITPSRQYRAIFYGLAKAAGDTTQSVSTNAVGTYTTEAKTAIRSMIGAAASADIPNVPVQDVQVNGGSILNNGIANIPIASADNLGVAKISAAGGITIESNTHYLRTARATASQIKAGTDTYRPIVPEYQDKSVFYGLAKAAGDSTQAASDNTVGAYTAEAKGSIQKMLGITDLLAPEENDLTANQAYSIGDIFVSKGKMYKATAAIAQDATIIPTTNCTETILVSEFARKTDTVLDTTLSRGRKAGTTIGTASLAFGINVEASGGYSVALGMLSVASANYAKAEGYVATASGQASHAEGSRTTASARNAHSEGTQTTASAEAAHSEGTQTTASGTGSHAEGYGTLANGCLLHVEGRYNQSATLYSTWTANTTYSIGDKVSNNNIGYICTTGNSDAEWNSEHWQMIIHNSEKAYIMGNGTSDNARSNAYALDWNGTAHYAGDVYVGCNNDSTSGTRLATVTEVAAKLDAADAGLQVVRLI